MAQVSRVVDPALLSPEVLAYAIYCAHMDEASGGVLEREAKEFLRLVAEMSVRA